MSILTAKMCAMTTATVDNQRSLTPDRRVTFRENRSRSTSPYSRQEIPVTSPYSRQEPIMFSEINQNRQKDRAPPSSGTLTNQPIDGPLSSGNNMATHSPIRTPVLTVDSIYRQDSNHLHNFVRDAVA
jgi:hypothetical protein